MNPYPLLLWLEEYGGSITGGMDASYCEAPPKQPAPKSSGTTPDLDTGDRNDARPSPVVEQNRDDQDPPEHEHKKPTEEKSEGTDDKSKKSKKTGATGDAERASPAGSSAKEDVARAERDESSTPSTVTLAPDVDRTSVPSTDGDTKSDPSQAQIRGKRRTLLKDPSPTDPTSRRSYIAGFADMLRKAKKNERDGRNTGASEKKQLNKEKQKKPKKRADSPERKELRNARSFRETKFQSPRPIVKNSPAPKKDREESPEATESKGRKLSEGGSR